MSNSVSHSVKFLSDENVDARSIKLLKKQGVDIISKPKELSNGKLAEFSKSEQRVLVTNDADFSDFWTYPKEEIFSVVLLRILQDKIETLMKIFSKLLKEHPPKEFEGNLITLYEERFEVQRILSRSELKLSKDFKVFGLF